MNEMVSFNDMDLTINKPTLSDDGVLVVSGNFTELASKVDALVKEYGSLKLTDANVSYVKTVKSHFTSLRTAIDKARKEWKKVYITPASVSIDAMCNELTAKVSEGENALKSQLDEYDNARREELTQIYSEYIAEFVEKYNLDEEHAKLVKIEESYYNKTAKENAVVEDIENQAKNAAQAQKEHQFAVQLIEEECKGTSLSPNAYIRELEYKSYMEVILDIREDKKTKENREETVKTEETALEETEVFEDETKEKVFRIVYKASQSAMIADFFAKNGIKCYVVK